MKKIIYINITDKLNEKILTIKFLNKRKSRYFIYLQKIHTYIKSFIVIQN